MKLDAIGRAFIQSNEGLELEAYLDVAGVPTIGYGTIAYPTGAKVRIGDVCTREQAESFFTHDFEKFEKAVNDLVANKGVRYILDIPLLMQNQFNALVSLAYNIGISGFKGSTLLKLVNSKDRNARGIIEPAFIAWNKIRKNGKLVASDGLTNRRKKEVDLYFSYDRD